MNKLRLIAFFVFLKFSSAVMVAQETTSVKIDSSTIAQKHFSENLSQKYSGDDFDYVSSVEGEAQNFIARALQWFFQKIGELFGFDIDPQIYQVIELIFYILLIILALYLIIKILMGTNASTFFGRNSKQLAPLNIQEEHIETIDLDKFIKDALAQKNYRLAIRYMYLKALKDLSFQNIIKWHFDKTNLDYYQEIENVQLKNDFKKVSYLYDYVWYGEFDIDQHSFENAQLDFERFTTHIKDVR